MEICKLTKGEIIDNIVIVLIKVTAKEGYVMLIKKIEIWQADILISARNSNDKLRRSEINHISE